MLKKTTHLIFYTFLLFLISNAVLCDTVVMKNGKRIQGKIDEEWRSYISVNTGDSVITIPRDMITTIIKSSYTDVIVKQVRESLERGRRLIQNGKTEEAKRFYQGEILKLERTMSSYSVAPEVLKKLRGELDRARRETLPKDQKGLEVENKYQMAMKALDHVRYEEAMVLLNQAASLDEERMDIRMRLGLVACQLNRSDEAIKAFKKVLETEPEIYYDEIIGILPELLDRRGKQLLSQKQEDKALDCYKCLLLLYSDEKDSPRNVREFQDCFEKSKTTTEEQTLLGIFYFSDKRVMMDLALSAIKKAHEVKPADKNIERLYIETQFLVEYLDAIRKRSLKRAVRLRNNTPLEILESKRVNEKVRLFMQDWTPEFRAEQIFLEGKNNFDAGKFKRSQLSFQKFLEEFPDDEKAKNAKEFQEKLRFEVPVEKSLDSINALFTAGAIDDAQAELDKLLKTENIEKSLQWNMVQEKAELLKSERNAQGLWKQLQKSFDKKNYPVMLSLAENISKTFPQTFTGKKAEIYLTKNRENLKKIISEQKVIENNLFLSLASPFMELKKETLTPEATASLWQAFEQIVKQKPSKFVSYSTKTIYALIAAFAVFVLLLLTLEWFPPGWGKLPEKAPFDEIERGFVKEGGETVFKYTFCRFCGLSHPPLANRCPHCGYSRKITDVEKCRIFSKSLYEEIGDTPPMPGIEEEESQQHMELARELGEKGNTRDAIKTAQMAYRENPADVSSLQYLAEMYEKNNRPEQAFLCYHKIALLEPGNLEAQQKILETQSAISSLPLKAGGIIGILSFLFWWTVFWVAVSVDPWQWAIVPRAGLCVLGFVLTTLLWSWEQKRHFVNMSEIIPKPLDSFQPLPEKQLSWKETNRMARKLSGIIEGHTGIELKPLTTGRYFLAVFLSLVLLFSLALIAWINQFPAALAAWVSGFFLLVYLLEIHPRILHAYILLRHFLEEVHAPWADPEMSFKPRLHLTGKGEENGEFGMYSLVKLPISWALKPFPYKTNRQGILKALFQVINRHGRFKNFYRNVSINAGTRMPMPVGFRRMTICTVIVCLLTVCLSLYTVYEKWEQKSGYSLSLRRGYQSLIDGETERARAYFVNAVRIDNKEAAPYLFLGHVYRRQGARRNTERFFRAARERAPGSSLVHIDYADYLISQGRTKEAVIELKSAMDQSSGDARLLHNIGAIYFKTGNYPEAIRYFERAAKADPNQFLSKITLGIALDEAGNPEKAKSAFENALKNAHDSPIARLAKSRLEDHASREIQKPE